MTRRRDGGQATVELVLVLPVVALALLALLQVALVARAEVITVHAAREGARVAAVGGDAAAVQAAVVRQAGLEAGRVTVEVVPVGDLVRVVVRYRQATELALIGPMMGDVVHVAEAVMWREDGAG